MTTWHVHSHGVEIYRDGVLVGIISKAQFGELLYRVAQAMR